MVKKQRPKHKDILRFLERKVIFRLYLYLLESLILIGVVVYEIVLRSAPPLYALLGIVIGIFMGLIAARISRLSWNHDKGQIVSDLDLFGGVMLVLYIIFSIFRSKIIGHFVQASAVGGITIALSTGAMIGRLLATRAKVMVIFKRQKNF